MLLLAVALLILAGIAFLDPRAGLAGWRTGFLFLQAVPVGAVVLLLIARLTGADWAGALLPLTAATPWLLVAFAPVVLDQALFHAAPPHLATWLSPPFFAVRGVVALLFWSWVAFRLRHAGPSLLSAGLMLLAHAVILCVIAPDWLLGVRPGQPFSAIVMVLAVSQIMAAAAFAIWMRPDDSAGGDLAKLMFAAALGLAYLLFVDYLVIWYGNIPARAGYYLERGRLPWGLLPPLALLAGLVAPLLTRRGPVVGGSALMALFLVMLWLVAPPASLLALPAAAVAWLVLPWRDREPA